MPHARHRALLRHGRDGTRGVGKTAVTRYTRSQAADPGDEEDVGAGEANTLFGAAEVTGVDVFAAIRDEPGNVSVKTIGQEAFKLGAIRAVGLPDDLLADVAPKVLAGWRARVAAEAPSHLRSHPHEIMVTLVAAYLYCRQREITDALVDLLIATVHRINARADTTVTKDFLAELISCSASEVHAMVEGAMRHGTDMEVEQNFVDSHGASFVGFGITRLLDFDLIARFKQINTMKLYVPGHGDQYAYPVLVPALTRPVRWEIIENNYDLMMKYATAIRLRTASTEALLRRFTSETTHPAYAAMLEVGRAQRSIFLARWLRDRDLQREIESGLNVVENYNGVNDYIRFGKRGELASNRREEQELGMLCLHILQSSLGLINTLMIQDTLALPEWAGVLTDADRRGLTPIFHANMTPYGEIQLRTDRRLDLTGIPPAASWSRAAIGR